jgi:hypothetical protein
MKKKVQSIAPGQGSNDNIFDTARHVSTQAGVPTQAGKLLELNYDSTNNDVYVNTDGSTTWLKILD